MDARSVVEELPMRHRLLASCLLASCLAALAAPLAAQTPPPPPGGYDPPPPGPDGQGPGGGGYGRHGGRPLTRDDAAASVQRGFAALDTNHDGVVTRDEVEAYRQARRAEMRARRDGEGAPPPPSSGGPGGPPPGGFGRGVGPLLNSPAWFDLADANHDGRVTPAEAQAGAMALFDRMDLNHDGTVDPDERRQAMMSMRGRGRPGLDNGAPPPQ
jgi:hypothetical protein